jgi:hypothetical protein
MMQPSLGRFLSGSSFDPAMEEATVRIAATENASTLLAPLLCRDAMPTLARKILEDLTFSDLFSD